MVAGSQTGFGRSLSLHRGTFASGGWLWYIGAVLLAAGVFNLLHAAGVPLPTRTPIKSAPIESLAMAAGSFVFGALLLIVPVLRWRQQVELFEGGFIWNRLISRVTVARSEVRGTELITHHSRSGSHVEVVVHLADGRELSLSGLSGADQLANMLTAYARPLIQPAMAAAPGAWRPPGT